MLELYCLNKNNGLSRGFTEEQKIIKVEKFIEEHEQYFDIHRKTY